MLQTDQSSFLYDLFLQIYANRPKYNLFVGTECKSESQPRDNLSLAFSFILTSFTSGEQGLPDAEVRLADRLDSAELVGVLSLLDKDRELQELLCDAQVGPLNF